MVMSASAPTGSRGTPGGPGLPSEFLNSVKGGGWGVRQANLGNFLKIPGIFFFNKNSHKKTKKKFTLFSFLKSPLSQGHCCHVVRCPAWLAWKTQECTRPLLIEGNFNSSLSLIFPGLLSRGSPLRGFLGGCSIKSKVVFLFLIEGWQSTQRKEILLTTNGRRLPL